MVLRSAHLDQCVGFAALVEQLVEMGGVGGEVAARQAGVAFVAGLQRRQQTDTVGQHPVGT
ncbi:hypothetical protein [Mycolicibacterium peregrinum]|uniref:hypothetical protein n=1 Tax=Mycolicibacterium peregrinum TaxID=43304 RepID=UPI003AAC5B55